MIDKREIKFRAWDKQENEMVVNPYLGHINDDKDTSDLMEFTGIKDKNNIEIYEGDILTNYHGDTQVVEKSGCQWITRLIKRKTSRWPAQFLHCEYMEWVVIRNIYKSPELLEAIK